MTTQRQGLAAYYAERFNSDPHALLDYCHTEISAVAAEVQIDWPALAPHVRLDDKKYRGKIPTLAKGHRHKVAVFGSLKRARNGIEFPHLNFHSKAQGGYTATWSGYDALLDLYRRDGGQLNDDKHRRWLAEQEKRRAERAARVAKAERQEREAEARRQAEHNAYELAWHGRGAQRFEFAPGKWDTVELLGDADGSEPYLEAKQIGSIVEVVTMKRMRDRHGEFVAFALQGIDGDYRGLQRLYSEYKKYTIAARPGQFDGAHCIIGSLDAKRVYSAEGFATAASTWLAETAIKGDSCAVIVAMNADNLVKVLRSYRRVQPDLRPINAADNDCWKLLAGNAGQQRALEIKRELELRSVMPRWEELLDPEAIAAARATGKGPTDFNDLHCLFGLEATAKALRARSSKVEVENGFFDYCLQRVAAAGQMNVMEEALRAVNAGMQLAPTRYTGRDVYRIVCSTIPEGLPCNRHRLLSRVCWLGRKKLESAAGLRSFTAEALARPNVQHHKVAGIRAEHGNVLLPEHVQHLVQSLDGMVIVRAPMGSGKTENLIRPLMQAAPKAAYIAHRVSLVGDAAYRLNTQHYRNVLAAEMPWVSHLACCVNSITHPKFANGDGRSWFTTVDTLCIDEASQVLRHIATGPVDQPTRVMDGLVEAIQSARQVLLCDADANDSLIELCEMARPGEPIHILEVDAANDHVRVDHSDHESVWQQALEAAIAGERVLVANDSAESAKKLAVMIHKYRPEARVLLVHKESKADPDAERFLDRPNDEAPRWDVLIYSPAISSGVSITTPHFTRHFGIFSGQTVSPSDAIQMLRRDRTARHYVLGIGISRVMRETDREALWRGLIAADELACDFEETSDEILLRRTKSVYDVMYLSCATGENHARNDFANHLLLMLIADGYQVHRLATNDDQVEASRANRKEGGALVRQRRLEILYSVETPDEDRFARLSRQELKSEAEQAEIDRHHIEHQLCVEQITDDDVDFYDDQGIRHVTALELLQATDEQADAYDKAQQRARVTLTRHRWKRPTRQLLGQVFEILGVDPLTGEGEFTVEQCRQVRDTLLADQAAIELYNALRIGRYVNPKAAPKCATTFVKSIMDRLGLTVHKRKSGGTNWLSISEESWEEVMHYVRLRAARGVHSLTTHEAASTHTPMPAPERDTPREASNDAACGQSDTLHGGVAAADEKYPSLAESERLYAAACAASKPLSLATPLRDVMRWLAPGIKRDVIDGRMAPDLLAWTLDYCSQRIAKALGRHGQGSSGLPETPPRNTV
ncbi:hypothetical protein K4A83_11080 [Spirulina subsalsa FACHB-351]|uniref:Replication origin-binding protein domain-containing protein n=1 Tax=Spirulina subsalsa FACHB-351 TaxID=234711 RepID=A0ABT3L5L5_9CYAN|nr:plasmid replication protein, CyRepA1 family [Spirulina subsalsa]MCW6036800.1 hypothetical protein [Spirulina subsalsa FACHB-351]